MSIALEKKLPLILLLAFLMLGAIGYFSFQNTSSLKDAVRWRQHTQDVLLKLDETLIAVNDVETSGRGYVIAGNDGFLEPFDAGKQNAEKSLVDLKSLTIDNPVQIDNLAQLSKQIDEKIGITKIYIERRRADGLLGAVAEVTKGDGDRTMDNIRQIVGRMKNEELRLLKFREDALQTTLDNNFWMMLVSSLAGIAALAVANFVVLFEIRKRRSAESDLVTVNRDLEKRVAERTDELQQVNEELRASELFNRSVIDSLSAHIAVLDRDGRIVLVNNAWESFAEANAAVEQLATTGIGQNYLRVCEQAAGDERLRAVGENLRSILAGEKQHFTVEYPCHSPTEERWFLMQVNALQGSNGGVVVSHYNISDRVRAELNERKARREAEIANRLRDEFMATVSHEMRTPLNAILGWARILKSPKSDDAMRGKAVDTIIKNAETQNRLIEDLLDVARIVSGKLVLETEDVNAGELVASAIETVRPSADGKAIALEFDETEEAAAETIHGDPNRLRQILWNLLTNAVKFTPEGGRVEVGLRSADHRVEISVKDNGAGISPEFLPYVFDRFRQDAEDVRKSGGLGLGLAIVRQLTELHGGTVEVHSPGRDQGAVFTVKLPTK
ncbi:MAG: CHASE3 domain-containing protein [Acidobacteria bacterium]|nr:CHASE3 domain-containing protein [Acidobacteriota bacterium]